LSGMNDPGVEMLFFFQSHDRYPVLGCVKRVS
jgi:hypothetical protein